MGGTIHDPIVMENVSFHGISPMVTWAVAAKPLLVDDLFGDYTNRGIEYCWG